MIKVVATNITSPLGLTTEQNYRAVRASRSKLARYDSWRTIPEPFVASMFDDEQRAKLSLEGYTLLESAAIHSVKEAMMHCSIDLTSLRTIFILSTTKANVDSLQADEEYLSPGATARKISRYFGFVSEPIVVCNACISGVDAQILAHRLLEAGRYDNAVVCGVDLVTPFVVAGFLSFKSLAMEECRPFDIERTGLNLGEAAATIIFSRKESEGESVEWRLCAGAMSNDAHHVSAPSPKGDGSCRAIERALKGVLVDDLALVSTHGTATMFNDQMESKAIERMGLTSLPISALKGYYGHTLGAAGVLEVALTMRALDDGIIPGVRGFEEIGVSGKIDISGGERTTTKCSFLKMISGFGGCNGALLCAKQPYKPTEPTTPTQVCSSHRVLITPQSVVVDGREHPVTETGKALLTELYKSCAEENPKFYKMDLFSRVVYIATELLVQQMPSMNGEFSILLFNRSSSIVADRKHIAQIADRENFYPSPSIFLYTLPNIALGEVAIRHACTGETSLYILEEKSEQRIREVVESVMSQSDMQTLIAGWVDCEDEDNFEADLQIFRRDI